MKESGTQSNVRWRELYPALTALAEAEGVPRAEIAREGVRLLLKQKGIMVPEQPERPGVAGTLGKIFVRVTGLIEDLEARAVQERRSVSVIVRKAIRFYLGQTRIPEVKQFLDEIKRLTDVMSRIGGNLNQVALAFNADDVLRDADLAQVHGEMKQAFREFSGLIVAIRGELERQRP